MVIGMALFDYEASAAAYQVKLTLTLKLTEPDIGLGTARAGLCSLHHTGGLARPLRRPERSHVVSLKPANHFVSQYIEKAHIV